MVIIITIKTGAADVKDKIKESRLRWYGHVKRSGDDSFLKNIMDAEVRGRRSQGRQRKRWIDLVRQDMKTIGITKQDTQRRSLWRRSIHVADPSTMRDTTAWRRERERDSQKSWALRRKEEQLIQRTEMRMLRWITGVTLEDKIRSEDIRLKTGVADVKDKIQESRLRWYGHVRRSEDDSFLKKTLWTQRSEEEEVKEDREKDG